MDIVLPPNATSFSGVDGENATTSLLPVGQVGNGNGLFRQSGLISQRVSDIMYLIIAQVSMPLIEAPGIVANVINLYVFWTIGLRDTVTSSFFALSLSDLGYLVAAFLAWVCFTLDNYWSQQKVQLFHLSLLIITYGQMFFKTSTFVTTYIAVQRCCCVALPLKFKGIFTAKVNGVVIVCICAVSICIYLPTVANQGLKKYYNPATNVTWYGLWFSEHHQKIYEITGFFTETITPISTEVVTVICMVVLVSSFRKSSKFRQSAMTAVKCQESSAKEVNNARKEMQVIKAVTVVTLLFIISNTPPVFLILTQKLVPTFKLYSQYHHLFLVCNLLRDSLQYVNASINIVVYYNFNSAFRSIVRKRIFSNLLFANGCQSEGG